MREADTLKAALTLPDIIDRIKAEQAIYDAAVSDQNRIISDNPGTDKAQRAELRICLLKEMYGTLQDAVVAYQQLSVKYQGKDIGFKAAFSLASICAQIGDIEKAKQVLVAAIMDAAGSADSEKATARLRSLFAYQGCYKEGVDFLRKLQQVHRKEINTPLGSSIAFNIGVLLDLQGSHTEALSACREALKRDHNSLSSGLAVTKITDIFLAQNQCSQAADALKDLESSYSGTESGAQAQMCLDTVYSKEGNDTLREKCLLSVLEKYPTSPKAKLAKSQLCTSYLKRADTCKNRAAAIVELKKAFEMSEGTDEHTGHATVLFILLANLQSAGDYADMHKYAQAELSRNPPYPGVYRHAVEYFDAMAYYDSGDMESALPAVRNVAAGETDKAEKARLQEVVTSIESKLGRR